MGNREIKGAETWGNRNRKCINRLIQKVSTFALTAAAAREAAAALAMFSSLMVFDLSPFSVSLSASLDSSIFTRR